MRALVEAADAVSAGVASSEGRAALADLAQTYWTPIYHYMRRRGYDPTAAEDLTQSFFTHLLERELVGKADADKGRFRNFLLAAAQYFLADDARRAGRLKRGGDVEHVAFDFEAAEAGHAAVASEDLTPEEALEREYARALVRAVNARLREKYVAKDRAKRFDRLLPFAMEEADRGAYGAVAEELGMTVNGARSAVFRLREQWREMAKEEVARGCAEGVDVGVEIEAVLLAP